MQPLNQRRILGFRVADEDIVVGDEKHVGDFALGAERFAAAGNAQNQTVGVFQQFAVDHNEVAAHRVDPVIERFAAGLEKLLRRERHKDGNRAGRQPTAEVQRILAQRKAGNQGVFLLEIQPDQRAVHRLRDALCLQDVVFKLALRVRRVDDDQRKQEHALIVALQVLQQLFRFLAVSRQIGGNDVHIVSGADGFFLFLDFGAVKLGDLVLDRFDGFRLVERMNVHGNEQAAFHIEKVFQRAVAEFGRENLQIGRGAVGLADAERPSILKLKRGRRDEILRRQPGWNQPAPVKAEGFLRIHVTDAVHQLQPRFAVEGLCLHAELAEVVQQIQFDAFQTGLGGFVGIRFNAESQVFLFLQAVVAPGELAAQHIRILGADAVKVIVLRGNVDALLKDFRVCRQIKEAELEVNRRVEVIQKIAPAVKERLLVLVLRELVVDILKLNRPRIARIRDAADAVRVHALIGDGFLRGMRRFLTAIRFFDFGADQLLSSRESFLRFFFFSIWATSFWSALCRSSASYRFSL